MVAIPHATVAIRFYEMKSEQAQSTKGVQGNRNSCDSPDKKLLFTKTESQLLAARIRSVIGDEYVASFGRRSGLSESLLRKYLAGAQPNTFNLVAIAAAGNVSIEWLATGRGQRERIPSAAPQPAPDNEAGEIAHIYSQATEPQRRAFRALANAVRNPSLRAWLDLGIAVGEAADLTPAARTQTQKKEP